MDPDRVRKCLHDPKILLRVSEQFLERRYLSPCQSYASEAEKIDPHFPGVNQILAIAAVLLAAETPITENLPDWYKIMQIERYSNKSELITEAFKKLYDLLNPSNNNFPFSDEAFDVVCDAWFLLSNPVKKLEYDENLMRIDNGVWTVCPYCYYVYEYDREYVDCCLRCENNQCGKAFTCLEIDRPPFEVLRAGDYLCGGFLFGGGIDDGWNPFSFKRGDGRMGKENDSQFVETSDDETKVKMEDEMCEKKVKVEDEMCKKNVKVEDEMCEKKVNGKRKKSVAKRTKKVTGVGNRVRKNTEMEDVEDDSCEEDDDILRP